MGVSCPLLQPPALRAKFALVSNVNRKVVPVDAEAEVSAVSAVVSTPVAMSTIVSTPMAVTTVVTTPMAVSTVVPVPVSSVMSTVVPVTTPMPVVAVVVPVTACSSGGRGEQTQTDYHAYQGHRFHHIFERAFHDLSPSHDRLLFGPASTAP